MENQYYEETCYKSDPLSLGENSPPPKPTSPRVPLPQKVKNTELNQDQKQSKMKKFLALFVLGIVVIVLEIALIGLVVTNSNYSISSAVSENVSSPPVDISCDHLKKKGFTKSGYYILENSNDKTSYKTFCDMTTAGGGWTLVASIKENDIKAKCSSADTWFSNENPQVADVYVSRNWENKNVFGDISTATSRDYKNPAYYSLKARDIMIQHLSQDGNSDNIVDRVFLQYHSSNGFLSKNGGNLFSLYRFHYSLHSSKREIHYPNVEPVLKALSDQSRSIIDHIPNFYNYSYGSHTSSLSNGGLNMFANSGMNVYVPQCPYSAAYEVKYNCPAIHSTLSTIKSHPFFALLAVNRFDLTYNAIHFRIRSYRPSSDTQSRYTGNIELDDYSLQYYAYCRYGSSVPSLCDVTYLVNSTKIWKSSRDFLFQAPWIAVQSTYYDYNQYIYQNPENVLLGYTMLSRLNGELVSQSNVEKTIEKMLKVITGFPNLFPNEDCMDWSKNLVVPINYTIGGDKMKDHIPTEFYYYGATPGYMQFRAMNVDGRFYAFCPGVRVETCLSRFLCIGGVKEDLTVQKDCSDYLEWDANSAISDLKFKIPLSRAHSLEDIRSTIMIYYR